MTILFFDMPLVKISWGDFFDRITILEIKKEKISDVTALSIIDKELESLNSELSLPIIPPEVIRLKQELLEINQCLWNIEDDIRLMEAIQKFDNKFIQLARSVYQNNDKRAKLKREINNIMKSDFYEVKKYSEY